MVGKISRMVQKACYGVQRKKKERSIATEITNNKLTREKAECICIHQI